MTMGNWFYHLKKVHRIQLFAQKCLDNYRHLHLLEVKQTAPCYLNPEHPFEGAFIMPGKR